jgi:hypothetical protein
MVSGTGSRLQERSFPQRKGRMQRGGRGDELCRSERGAAAGGNDVLREARGSIVRRMNILGLRSVIPMLMKSFLILACLLLGDLANATCIRHPDGSSECHAPGDGPVLRGRWESKVVAREEAFSDDLVEALMSRWQAFRGYNPKSYRSASIVVVRHTWKGATVCEQGDPRLTYDDASTYTLCLKDSDGGQGNCVAGASSLPAPVDPCL